MAQTSLHYLELLSKSFPTESAAFTEIINLEAILNLPKGTEHFMSDIHGEAEAFNHILNNCSGVIKEEVDRAYQDEMEEDARRELCTLIYYPKEKLALDKKEGKTTEAWYLDTLFRLIRLARWLSSVYTRSKVRKALPETYAYIIEELLHASGKNEVSRHNYHVQILNSIVSTGAADDFIVALSSLIKRLAVDHLHIVGDIFDRGSAPDQILDTLIEYHSLDIQWGNHDICWMGAAAGSAACIASVVRTSVRNHTLDVLESAYGISLRPLALFARNEYGIDSPYTQDEVLMEKAINVLLFKLEGQLIRRHPEFQMEDRLLLDKLEDGKNTITIDGREHRLNTSYFPTFLYDDPYVMTRSEEEVIDYLTDAFTKSKRLKRHVEFLYSKGSIYKIYNNNLLFHGCIPLNSDGSFSKVNCEGELLEARDYLDFCDHAARVAWRERKLWALDWMWYLWCGRHSPLSGRIVKTFERSFILDKEAWTEPDDAYYKLCGNVEVAEKILAAFGVDPVRGHIVNGHTPVRTSKGESPVRAGGKYLCIDGGFCEAYHKKTGIAGYTLIASSNGLFIKAHEAFAGVEDALVGDADIASATSVLERELVAIKIKDTDIGRTLEQQIEELKELLSAYRTGKL